MLVQKISLSNNRELRIFQDDDSTSPREWDNMAKMFCFHKRYSLGDEHKYNSSDFSSWTEFKKQVEKDSDVAIILPLFLYDHSGISISTSYEYPYTDKWDAGQVGWVFITKDTIRKEYNVKHVTKSSLQKALTYLLGEVEVYDQYLTGEVYSFDLVEFEVCDCCGATQENSIDSCSGFFGSDLKKNGILGNLQPELRAEVEAKI